jgi:hypothetical protein
MAKYPKWVESCGCPKKYIYKLTKNYFSQQTAILSTNTFRMEREVSRGPMPQASCCLPGLWNILNNSVLNIKLKRQTRAAAFDDDLILAVRGRTVCEAENLSKWELSKITEWSKSNESRFKEVTLMFSKLC